MPTQYKRRPGSNRGRWTEENLREAIRRIEAEEIGINEAERYYGIPSRTLRHRRTSGNLMKISLGPQGTLGPDNENRLVEHIQRLEKAGFAANRTTVTRLAFEFAESMGIKHRFNKESRMAGYDWLHSFLNRNKEVTIRQSEGLSLARAVGMNRSEVDGFFNILNEIYDEQGFYTKPGHIFNMDETGCHLNNEPGEVLATK